MSQYLMDSGHNDMRTCDDCGGAFYASRGPSGEEEDWTCDTCTEKDATIKALAGVLVYLRDNDSVSDDGRARIKTAISLAERL